MTLFRYFTEKNYGWITGQGWPRDLAKANFKCYQHQTLDTGRHNHGFTTHTHTHAKGRILINTSCDAIRLIPASFGSPRQAASSYLCTTFKGSRPQPCTFHQHQNYFAHLYKYVTSMRRRWGSRSSGMWRYVAGLHSPDV
jgi:hypothetical protein